MKSGRAYSLVFIFLTFLFWLASYPPVPIVSAFADAMGASAGMIGLIGGAYGLAMVIVRMPLGILSDRLGKRKIFIILGGAAALCAAAVVQLRPSPQTLLFSRALCGIQASAWVPFTVLYAHAYPPEQSARAMSVLTAVYTASQLLSMLAGGFLSERFSYLAPYALAAAGGILFLALSPLMRDTPAQKAAPAQEAAPLKEALTPRLLVLSFAGIVFFYVKYATAYTFTPLIAQELGASDAALGMLNTFYCLCGIPGSMFSYRLARRFGAGRLIAAALLILAVCSCFAVPFLPNLPLLYLSLGISGFFTFLLDALLAGLVILGVEERRRSTAMGFYQAVYGLGILAGPVLSGRIIEFAGRTPAYAAAGVLAVVCAAVILAANRKEPIPC
ncbi:MAG: MFS transporter [Eubacteriales bacterium]|nr:MFS transporter [Eubacteriales bacterium]